MLGWNNMSAYLFCLTSWLPLKGRESGSCSRLYLYLQHMAAHSLYMHWWDHVKSQEEMLKASRKSLYDLQTSWKGHKDEKKSPLSLSILNSISSATQSCLTLSDSMNCSISGIPVHHQLPEFTQTEVHWVGDYIQPSHPLSSPSPPALNLSQNQGLFQWVSSLHQVAKVLAFQLQYQSFQWIFRTDFSFRTDWLDLLALQGTLKSSNTTVQKP